MTTERLVYIVVGEIKYEGSDVLGVWCSGDEAEADILSHSKNLYPCDEYWIEVWDLKSHMKRYISYCESDGTFIDFKCTED